ncbi:MAG: ribonuclease HI family protein [Actinomycetota bacterium]
MRVLPKDSGPRLTIATDGAARGNPGPAGIGVVVTDSDGRVVAEVGEAIGRATNNVAEYRAVIRGLELAAEHGAREVLVRSDSRLLVEQLSGRFKVKNAILRRLHQQATTLLGHFDDAQIEHVPREFNADADHLANLGIDQANRSLDYPAEDPGTLFDEAGED